MAYNAVPGSGFLCNRKYPDDPTKEVFEAAEFGDAVLLSEVLQQMKANEKTSALETAYIIETDLLIVAAGNGNLDCVKVLIVEHEANVDLQNTLGDTPLMIASRNGHVDVVSFLVEHGADMNLQDESGHTPLMIACSYDDADVVTFLVQHGANVNLQNKNGDTALDYFLCQLGDYSDDYCCAVLSMLSCLITNGADVNAPDHGNCTPLMIASRSGHIDAVTFLVEHGANMDLQDKNGNTALHYAVTSNKAEVVGYCVVDELLTRGASQLYNNEQFTPLLEASNNSQSLMVEHLLKRTEYTKEQRIDALELLGASLATCQLTPDTARAFHYIKCGMKKRFQDPSQPLFKQPMEPVQAYQNKKESQTLEELAQIEGDRYAIIMEGLVIRERILGTENTALLEGIRHVVQYNVHWNFDDFVIIGLCRHAIKIAKHCNQSICEDIRSIIGLDLINVFLSQKDLVLELLEEIVVEYEKQEKARKLESLEFKLIYGPHDVSDLAIQLVQIIAKFKHFKEDKTSPVSLLLQKLYNLNLRDDNGNTLLHNAVLEHRESCSQKCQCIDTMKLLLNSGFNVNAINKNGDTPLHNAVKYIHNSDKIHCLTNILEALLDGGAHHDFVNNDGKSAMDMAETDEAHMILSEKRKLELKCISARAVKKFGLPYLGVVPKTLEKFISMH